MFPSIRVNVTFQLEPNNINLMNDSYQLGQCLLEVAYNLMLPNYFGVAATNQTAITTTGSKKLHPVIVLATKALSHDEFA